MNWILGPKVDLASDPIVQLRNMTTDIETIPDTIAYMRGVWAKQGAGTPEDEYLEYQIPSGPIDPAALADLSVHDRNGLSVTLIYRDRDRKPSHNLVIYAKGAYILLDSPRRSEDIKAATTYLYDNSTQRVAWGRLAFLAPFIPVVLTLTGFLWLITTTPTPAPVFLVAAGVTILMTTAAIASSRRIYLFHAGAQRNITFRGQSRATTYADRANRWANFRVALITTIIALPIGIIATVIATWLTGDI